jgi:hypothetical protein
MLVYFRLPYRKNDLPVFRYSYACFVVFTNEHLLFNVVDLSWASVGWRHRPPLVKASPFFYYNYY